MLFASYARQGAGMAVECRAGDSAAARYRPRRPSESVLYRCVQEHLESWLAECRYGHDDEGSVPEYVEWESAATSTAAFLPMASPAPAADHAATTS
jgi:hypothetical protein